MTKISTTILTTLFILQYSFGQVSISGPTCVTPGITYQYNVSGNWDSATTLKICVNGGNLVNAGSNCQTSGPLSLVKIVWNETSNGSISLSSIKGNASLNVGITDTLTPGTIDTVSKTQTINYNDIPKSIVCSVATGGSCTPSYSYQWQQSPDKVNWTNIPNGTLQFLNFSGTPNNPGFYRRKVTEQNSGTTAYSNVLAIYIIPVASASK